MFPIKDHLEVKGGHLTIGGVDSDYLAEQYGTPLFITNETRVRENYRRYKAAFPDADIYYAAKANGGLALLRILASEGAGADVFSGGELYLALLAGIPREKILFNGNSKTDEEIEMAVEAGVKISVDSLDELRAISRIADKTGRTVEIAFRVNPEVSPKTHPKIATGLRESKFGIPPDQVINVYKQAMGLPGIKPVGIHCHIGSQILEVSPFAEAAEKMMGLVEQVARLGVDLEFVDLGSGLGIPYRREDAAPTPKDLADAILPIFEKSIKAIGIHPKLILEPGRYIVGDTTILLTRVNTVKRAAKNFVGVDAGFNLLIRPIMYDSYHHVVAANKAREEPQEVYTVVGPICEAGDILARDRGLPRIEKGDLIAFLDTGAYGFSMSSQYNGRPRCAEVLVSRGTSAIIRKREDYPDLLANQIIPPHLI